MNKKKLCRMLAAAVSAAVSFTMLMTAAFAEGEQAASSGSAQTANTASPMATLLLQMAPLIAGLLLLYMILIRPQQKREKTAQAMRDNVAVGDEVCTAGGIVGIVLKVEDETVVIETGMERNKIRIKKWAIHENITQMEEQAQAEKERKAARRNGITTASAEDTPKKKKKQSDD